MEGIIFYIIALVTIVAALRVVMGRNAVHSALWLVLVFFCFGAFYVLLQAEFVAAIQVIVYAGAIMVLFLFVIMLLRVDRPEELPPKHRSQRVVGVLLGIALLIGVGVTVAVDLLPGKSGEKSIEALNTLSGGNTQALAEKLFTDYLLHFEATSALLLAAIVGAVILAKRKEEK
ncbi:MAG TPA: NADH-quinone oxidoreductase subunit J [Thermodesulfobacteriota bacterium]|nr:NADH-quinone oxidoreductase subunit J [Thermodesulfobacteriota bacterium]